MKGRIAPALYFLGRMRPLRRSTPGATSRARLGAFLTLILLLTAAVNFGSSAAELVSGNHTGPESSPIRTYLGEATQERAEPSRVAASLSPMPLLEPAAMAEPAAFIQTSLGIETYNCTTGVAQTVFDQGADVCARATGVPAAAFPEFKWRVSWVMPAGIIVQTEPADSDQATEYDYNLPAGDIASTDPTDPNEPASAIQYKTRGTWRVNLTRANGSVRASAAFSVRSPQRSVADLFVQKFPRGANASFAADKPINFVLVVGNKGPDTAQQVALADALPQGASLTSFSQLSGEGCLPAGSQNCTIASLGRGERAEFSAIYTGGTVGTALTSASVSSATAELDADDNTASVKFEISASGGGGESCEPDCPEEACTLECPNDVSVSANTNENGDPNGRRGAHVTFGAAESFGGCGALTTSHASGSFFPLGTTTVSTSSSAGGGSCSFNVTVVESAGPTISCPADVERTLDSGCSVAIPIATPTASAGATVEADRSDNQPLDAPFSAGATTITWTATDSLGRTASCTQAVEVNVNDTTVPTITAPADLTLKTGAEGGACGLVIGEGALGRAEAEDGGCSVNITRTGVPQGNFFPVGTTTVTWTATDAGGNTATATQTVTVEENTLPVIRAPEDASYACLSEVPAAHPSQATGADDNLPNGGPPSDNCAAPVVTVTETSEGVGSASSPLVITRTFTATDAASNTASDTQTITVIDDTPPTITLNGADAVTVECHTPFDDPRATAEDSCDSSPTVTDSGSVDVNTPGTYTVTYTATDGAGNTASVQRIVTVVDTIKPVITRNGGASITHECHTEFTDPGATAADSCDTSVPVNASGAVNVNVPGTYTITYNASDDSGNAAEPVTLTVIVVDTTKPTVALNGAAVINHECHTEFTDPGATAADSCDTSVPVSAAGLVDVNTPGTYTITYTAADDAGNSAVPVTRTVNVVDTTKPVISCPSNIVVTLPANSTAVSMPVGFPAPTATDSCDASVPVVTSKASGSVFPVGTTVVTATATDDAGNSDSCSFTVTVLFNFTGFFSPVNNLPTLNQVNAGRAIPVKFSLSGNKGLNVFAAGSPSSGPYACGANDPAVDVSDTVEASENSFSYSAGSDQYNFVWKTEKSWAGTCRQLVLVLSDGSIHRANFKFK